MGDRVPRNLPPSFIREPDTDLDAWAGVWQEGAELQVTSHRPVIGPVIVLLKRMLRALVKPAVADLFDLQNAFNSVLIHNTRRVETEGITRLQDAEEHREARLREQTDRLVKRSDSLFVVLDKRLETLDRQLERFAEEQTRQTRTHLDDLTEQYRRNLARLDDLSRRLGELRQQQFLLTRKFEQLLTRDTAPARGGAGDQPASAGEKDIRRRLDHHAYYLFENIFRGPEEVIRDRQRIYLPYFEGRSRVLDIGCGRGEFLELLREKNISGYGLDLNEDMVHLCREKNLEVVEDEALAHLRGLEDESLGGIFMAQFIEHLPADTIIEMAKASWAKLEPGACVIMETQNPLSMVVSARNFYTDLSHIRPVHPEAARFLLQMVGFREVELKLLSPFTADEKLAPVLDGEDSSPSRDRHLFEKIERNFRRVDELLFGHQDYAVIGKK